MLAHDIHAHKVILVIYETVDDTVLSSKAIFPTLLGREAAENEKPILNAAFHPIARRSLLYLPAGRTTRLLPADVLELLTEVDDARQATSKKDPERRRAELLEVISPSLIKTIAMDANTLSLSHLGCQFISEVLLGCVGEKDGALAAVAELARGDPSQPDHLAARPAAAIMWKNLIRQGQLKGQTERSEGIVSSNHRHWLLLHEHR